MRSGRDPQRRQLLSNRLMGVWGGGLPRRLCAVFSRLNECFVGKMEPPKNESWADGHLSFLAMKRRHGNIFITANMLKYKHTCFERWT